MKPAAAASLTVGTLLMQACEQTWAQVIEAIEQLPGHLSAAFELASGHALDCSACAYRLDQLGRAIWAGNPATCAENRFQLEVLLDARRFDEPLDLELQSVAAHLATCPECLALAEALQMLNTLEGDEPNRSVVPPAWATDFLRAPKETNLWEPTGEGIQSLKVPLRFTWRDDELALTDVESSPALLLMPLQSRGRGLERSLQIRLPDPSSGYEVELMLRTDAKGRAALAAAAIDPSTLQPLEGSRLVLADAADPDRIYQRVSGQTPAPLGQGEFCLKLSVQERRWEIVLSFEVPPTLRPVQARS